jgi:hypothetical protein
VRHDPGARLRSNRHAVALRHPLQVRSIALAGRGSAPVRLGHIGDQVSFLALASETYLLTLADAAGQEVQVVMAPADRSTIVDGFAVGRAPVTLGDEVPRDYVLVVTSDGSPWWVGRTPISRASLGEGASNDLRRALLQTTAPGDVQMCAAIMTAFLRSQRTDLVPPTQAVQKLVATAHPTPFAVPPGAFIAHTSATYSEGSSWVVFDTFEADR